MFLACQATDTFSVWDEQTLRILFKHRLLSSIYGRAPICTNSVKKRLFKLRRSRTREATCEEIIVPILSKEEKRALYEASTEGSKKRKKSEDMSLKQEDEGFCMTVALPLKLLPEEAMVAFENGYINMVCTHPGFWKVSIENSNELLKFSQVFPKTDFEKRSLMVFRDLWSKGWIISRGSNFGCNYLAYCMDPGTVHSSFMVVVTSSEHQYSAVTLNSLTSLATKVRKQLLLAFADEDVTYVALTGCLFRRTDFMAGKAEEEKVEDKLSMFAELGEEQSVSI